MLSALDMAKTSTKTCSRSWAWWAWNWMVGNNSDFSQTRRKKAGCCARSYPVMTTLARKSEPPLAFRRASRSRRAGGRRIYPDRKKFGGQLWPKYTQTMRISGLKKFRKARAGGDYFEDLPWPVQQEARRWLWKFKQRWGR